MAKKKKTARKDYNQTAFDVMQKFIENSGEKPTKKAAKKRPRKKN